MRCTSFFDVLDQVGGSVTALMSLRCMQPPHGAPTKVLQLAPAKHALEFRMLHCAFREVAHAGSAHALMLKLSDALGTFPA